MVVRLHTIDGKTKVYETHRGEGGGENGPSKYVTKCGIGMEQQYPNPTKRVITLTVPLMC